MDEMRRLKIHSCFTRRHFFVVLLFTGILLLQFHLPKFNVTRATLKRVDEHHHIELQHYPRSENDSAKRFDQIDEILTEHEQEYEQQNGDNSKPNQDDGPILKKNPWFDGVFDTMTPLREHYFLKTNDTGNNEQQKQQQEIKEFCQISRELEDNEDRSDFYEDTVLPLLMPFTRSPSTNKSTSFGGVTSQKFGFPCPLEDVLVAYSEPLDFSDPANWTRLVDEMNEEEAKKDVRDTSQVWYSYIDNLKKTKKRGRSQLKTFTLGINPIHGLEQIDIARHFYSQMNYQTNTPPPDIFIFVIDGTSRSSFHRSFPSLVQNLRKKERPIDVFEMFRYSSLAWGTFPNMEILLRGCGLPQKRGGTNQDLTCDEMDVPLHLWLASSGYVLLGDYPYDSDMKTQFGEVFSASHGLRTHHIDGYKRMQMDALVDLALDQSAFYSRHAPDLPQYFVAHIDDNHGHDTHIRGQESSFFRLLNGIDFSNRNSMVIFMADHGSYAGNIKPLRDVEKRNPLLLAAVSRGALSSSITNKWNKNQQRFTTHWDTHATLKSLPLQYGTGWPKIEDYCHLDGNHGASTCGPYSFNSSRTRSNHADRSGSTMPWQKNWMLSVIPKNRTCSDAMSLDQFCFCGGVPSEGREWDEIESHDIIHNVVSELNQWTGNGALDCLMHQEDDFVITDTLSYDDFVIPNTLSYLAGHHSVTIDSKSTKASYTVLINTTMQATYMMNKYELFAPTIIRQDRFDEEKCLITYPDGRMPIFKSNATAGKGLMLRWCSCKSSTNSSTAQ